MKKFGFTLLEEKALPEIGGTLQQWEHEKTGAKLAWLQRPDDNKTFGIAFTTLPEDSTGVFHILEHSVLCGSDRYPVKEPFVELLKNSMNTFLNAMTFQDKTFYPVSSRNEKDFLNLMRVYLDAVFHPLIYSKPEIFYQEGWHYEFDENGKPSYKGVVFNEMKGAYASADQHLQEGMNAMLFPDNCYRFSSGGDPTVIPELTYEGFLDAHRRFYSPSNSFIFLDGDMDIDLVLSILDTEYLNGFEKGERIAPPAMQAPLQAGVQHITYELGAEEPLENRWRTGWGNVICDYADKETILAMQVLSRVLCGSNQAPLSRCILEKGLAENVSMQVVDGVLQPWVLLDVQNFTKENLPVVEETIRTTLCRLAEGLDREQLVAQMANLEFKLREADFGGMPRGLVFGIRALESWLYGGDPAAHMVIGDVFDRLREKLEQGYFEDLLRRMLMKNKHSAQIVMEPSHSLGQERREAEQLRLDIAATTWTEEEKQVLQERCQRIQAWQASEDSPEQLATLPRLELSDISPDPENIPTKVVEVLGLPVLLHKVSCGGIVYANLYFDIDDRTEDQLSLVSLMAGLLGDLATEGSTAQLLMNRRQLLCGNLQCSARSFGKLNAPLECQRKLCVSFSTLESNLEKALELVVEIITATKFDEEANVLDILRQWKTGLMQQIIMGGSSVAAGRISAQMSAAGVADECIGGFAFYNWLKKTEENWDWAALRTALESAYMEVFCKNRLTVSITGTAENAADVMAEGLVKALPAGSLGAPVALKPWGKRREGIAIPADISFAVKGGSLLDAGGSFNGRVPLASRIIGLAYLWNTIRVQGGAYGAGLIARPSGLACCYSYRDPNAARSLEQYEGSADFLRQLCQAGTDLTGFIIGAVSDDSPLLTPRMMGSVGDSRYFSVISYDVLKENRKALLSCTAEELMQEADRLEKVLKEGGVCVIGSQVQLENCQLEEILSL